MSPDNAPSQGSIAACLTLASGPLLTGLTRLALQVACVAGFTARTGIRESRLGLLSNSGRALNASSCTHNERLLFLSSWHLIGHDSKALRRSGKSMAEDPEERGEAWWQPAWEPDDEAELERPGPLHPRQPTPEPDNSHPLLIPLARAQDAVARLEARAEVASPAVAEGLRARMSYREAAGWLAHAQVWVHPQDLALRDAGLTGSYGAAARRGRLEVELPATAAHGSGFDAIPSDVAVNLALRLARLQRRLAEFRTWAPVADASAVRETVQSLGWGGAVAEAEAEQWLAAARGRTRLPALIWAGRTGRDWMNRRGGEPLSPDGIFLAACLWREQGFGRLVTLPFWAAPGPRHHRLSLQVGLRWMAGFLECVAAATKVAQEELVRLESAQEKGRALVRTSRSHLPAAIDVVLRAPIVTTRSLARDLDVTPQAAVALLRELMEAGIVREATGRVSWRAFVLA